MIRTTLQEPPTRLSFTNSACHPLYALKKSSIQKQNFTIRQLWVVSKYLQRMMFLQKHSLVWILTNPSVKEILSTNPKSLGHNQNNFFCPLVNLYYSGDVQSTSFVTRWKALTSYRYNQSSKTRIMRTPSSEPETLVSFDFSPYNELIFRFKRLFHSNSGDFITF